MGHTAHIKGAPNYILDECSSCMAADGTVLPLDDEAKKVSVCVCVFVSVCVCERERVCVCVCGCVHCLAS